MSHFKSILAFDDEEMNAVPQKDHDTLTMPHGDRLITIFFTSEKANRPLSKKNNIKIDLPGEKSGKSINSKHHLCLNPNTAFSLLWRSNFFAPVQNLQNDRLWKALMNSQSTYR